MKIMSRLRNLSTFIIDKLKCAISIICLAVNLVLVLGGQVLVLVHVLLDSLRTYFKSMFLSWSLEVRSLSLSRSLGTGPCPCPGPWRSGPYPCPGPWGQVPVLSWSLGSGFLSLSLGVRSMLSSLPLMPFCSTNH